MNRRGPVLLGVAGALVAGTAGCGGQDTGRADAAARDRLVTSCADGEPRDRRLCSCIADKLRAAGLSSAIQLDALRDEVESGRVPGAVRRASLACRRRA